MTAPATTANAIPAPPPPAPGTQTQQTERTQQAPAPAEPNEHPATYQPTGQNYQPPGDTRSYPVYRDSATGQNVYFPNLK